MLLSGFVTAGRYPGLSPARVAADPAGLMRAGMATASNSANADAARVAENRVVGVSRVSLNRTNIAAPHDRSDGLGGAIQRLADRGECQEPHQVRKYPQLLPPEAVCRRRTAPPAATGAKPFQSPRIRQNAADIRASELFKNLI